MLIYLLQIGFSFPSVCYFQNWGLWQCQIQMLVILYRIQKIDGMQRFTKWNIEGFDEVQNSFEIPRPDCCLKIIKGTKSTDLLYGHWTVPSQLCLIFLRINAKITLSVKFAVFRHLPFSIVGQNIAIYASFVGKSLCFQNCY